jgi:hypothetical protein
VVRIPSQSSCWTPAGEVIYATPMMINRKLIVVGVALALWNLAGSAGREEQVARESQEYDAECHKFGTATGTPAYVLARLGP